MPTPIDVYADDMQPKLEFGDVIVKVSVPLPPETSYGDTAFATLTIERDTQYIAGFDWYWFGVKNPRKYTNENWSLLEIRKEVLGWLVEWELLELRPIGPEDSEYFATDKLMEFATKGG